MSTLRHMSTEHSSPAVFITAPNKPTDRMPGSTAKIYMYASLPYKLVTRKISISKVYRSFITRLAGKNSRN